MVVGEGEIRLGAPQPRKVLDDRFINSPLIIMCC